MSIWFLLQLAANVFLFLAVWILWTKFRRPPKDDPRLSRGLQLLQAKISVLEDLSDKTDNQVKQLSSLLERKCREVQAKIEDASHQVSKIDQSMAKSLDVASIFEDRIPHQEIIERQRTKAYVRAAKMANQGASLAEINAQVNLSQGEIEMIMQVNKDRLMFSEDELPAWALSETGQESNSHEDLSQVFSPPIESSQSLEQIGEKFRQACDDMREEEPKTEAEELQVESPTEKLMNQLSSGAVSQLQQMSSEGLNKSDFEKAVEKIGFQFAPKKEVQAPLEPQTLPQPEVRRESPKQEKVLQMTGKKKMVDSDQIKRVQFPRIDMNSGLS